MLGPASDTRLTSVVPRLAHRTGRVLGVRPKPLAADPALAPPACWANKPRTATAVRNPGWGNYALSSLSATYQKGIAHTLPPIPCVHLPRESGRLPRGSLLPNILQHTVTTRADFRRAAPRRSNQLPGLLSFAGKPGKLSPMRAIRVRERSSPAPPVPLPYLTEVT